MEKQTSMPGTALLVMDIQTNILTRFADPSNLLDCLKTAIAGARAAGIPIIYVGLAFRKNLPEISPDNRSFAPLKQNNTIYGNMEEPYIVHPAIAPQEGDIMVTKRRVSGFTGSDLELVLRSLKVQQLVLSGISTSGVVLSTLREAADKDYILTVLSDGCADNDEQLHNILLTKVFPRQAEVLTAAEWQSKVNAG
jgi:nicotinamidase-related amidase